MVENSIVTLLSALALVIDAAKGVAGFPAA
jgi:hypothetical protein